MPFPLSPLNITTAKWNEHIFFDIDVFDKNTVFFFELVDFKTRQTKQAGFKEWNSIAWAYFRLLSPSGELHLEEEVRFI